MNDDTGQWWDQRYTDRIAEQSVARVLADNRHLLPAAGTALDLACGLGANARLLARHGLDTWAWDVSPVAIDRLAAAAMVETLSIHVEVRDVTQQPPEPARFDVIVVSHFLERSLAGPLMAALRPGGLLFYQTFTKTRIDDSGPRNPDFRLDAGELRQLFAGLQLCVYREEGRLGDLRRGFRNEALLIAQKE